MSSPDSETEISRVAEGDFVTLGNGTGESHWYYISSEAGENRVNDHTVITPQFAEALGLLGAELGATIKGVDPAKALKILSIETRIENVEEPAPVEP